MNWWPWRAAGTPRGDAALGLTRFGWQLAAAFDVHPWAEISPLGKVGERISIVGRKKDSCVIIRRAFQHAARLLRSIGCPSASALGHLCFCLWKFEAKKGLGAFDGRRGPLFLSFHSKDRAQQV